MHFTMKRVYLNGEWLPPEQARVSVFDRGFVFGDGVYEVIPAYGRRLFRLKHHLQRLDNSLAAIGLRNPLPPREWEAVLTRLLDENSGEDQSVYVEVTRGPAPRDHAFPAEVHPTVFAYAQPIHYPEPSQLAGGVSAITTEDIRWRRCDIKAIALLPNVLMRQEAKECGAAEAILIRDGYATEGAASNIFIVEQGVLVTPPKGPFILPGITRDLILELAHAHGVQNKEEPIAQARLFDADEVWMTSSTREVLPITRIDGQAIGGGRPGPVAKRMYGFYQDYKQAFRAGRAE
jgi:D-alanine transaminase